MEERREKQDRFRQTGIMARGGDRVREMRRQKGRGGGENGRGRRGEEGSGDSDGSRAWGKGGGGGSKTTDLKQY